MNWKALLAILGGLLAIVCGEAIKLGLKNWADLSNFTYWMGNGIQIAGLISAYTGGLYQDKPKGLDVAATAQTNLVKSINNLAPLVLLVLLVPFVTGCANKAGMNTALNLVPILNDEIKAVSDAIEVQKVPLQAQTCGTSAVTQAPVDCYVVFTGILEKVAGYDRVYREAAKALNTTSALQAVKDMSQVVQNAVQTEVLKLPEKIRTFVLVALEALRGGLAAAQVSLGG